MGTLYIDRKEIELRAERGKILVYEAGTHSGSIPLSQIERVVIQNRALIDTGVLGALAEQGIGVIIVSQRNPERVAQMNIRSHNEAARRIAQYRSSLDETWRIRCSAMLVRRKLRMQQQLLKTALARRPDLRHPLTHAINNLAERLDSLNANKLADRDTIRGIEGAGAAAYFKGYCSLFPPSLDFSGRNRRPPKDPVNACLSLAYTILHAEAVIALQIAGLDPLIGFYHDLAFGRSSLACDIVEPLRPMVDEWIWRQFRDRTLRAEDFSIDKGACLLNKAGRRTFYQQWEVDVVHLRRRLRRYARMLARWLMLRYGVPEC